MKYILLIVIVFILSALAYKYIFSGGLPPDFEKAVNNQPNPFTVPGSEAKGVWNRAAVFVENRKHFIDGGPMQLSDTLLFIPYVPGLSYNRGTSISVHKNERGDSTDFFVEWSYYDMPDSFSAREMAFFMQSGIGRYGFK